MARKRTTSAKRNFVDIYGNYHTGYTHKTKSGRHQLNLAQELADVINEYANGFLEQKEVALDKARDFLIEKFEQASPVDTGEFKRNWIGTDKYTGVRYIGNTTESKSTNEYGYHIPLSNLIEFSSKGKPFMRQAFEQNKEQIIDIIVKELQNVPMKENN